MSKSFPSLHRQPLRFLCDENVPLAVERELQKLGNDVEAVRLVMPGANDSAVLKRALSENRILVTLDRDFGSLIFRSVEGVAPAVVYLRSRLRPERYAEQIPRILEQIELGYFLVVDERNIRKRRMRGNSLHDPAL